jgi:hypothetical protein
MVRQEANASRGAINSGKRSCVAYWQQIRQWGVIYRGLAEFRRVDLCIWQYELGVWRAYRGSSPGFPAFPTGIHIVTFGFYRGFISSVLDFLLVQ